MELVINHCFAHRRFHMYFFLALPSNSHSSCTFLSLGIVCIRLFYILIHLVPYLSTDRIFLLVTLKCQCLVLSFRAYYRMSKKRVIKLAAGTSAQCKCEGQDILLGIITSQKDRPICCIKVETNYGGQHSFRRSRFRCF